MSSNSEYQDEVIDILNECPPAQPFVFAHIDTNGRQYYSNGQSGNAPDWDSSKEYQLRLLAMILLNLEIHFDESTVNLAESALETADAIKRGKLDANCEYKLGLEKDRY